MKILQLIYESKGSLYGFGGAGIRAYEIYNRLKDKHDITLLCMKYPGAKDGFINGINHKFVGIESNSLTKSVFFYILKASKYIKNKGSEFDVIVENFLPATPFFSCFLTSTPVVLQIQGIMKKHALKKYPLHYGLSMAIIECFYPYLFKNFIFVNNVGIERLKKKAKKYKCIPNGVDEILLKTKPIDNNYILFLSRIDIYTKGLDLLIDAFKNIAEKYREIHLILGGYAFDDINTIIRRVPDKLRDRIKYVGFVTGKKKIELLKGAKLFVLPSRHEAHPVSLLEAMACAKPVIVSDIEELNYVKQMGIGLTFKSGSSTELSKKISFLIENDKLRESLGKKARKYTSSFLWDKIAQQFEDFLENVIS